MNSTWCPSGDQCGRVKSVAHSELLEAPRARRARAFCDLAPRRSIPNMQMPAVFMHEEICKAGTVRRPLGMRETGKSSECLRIVLARVDLFRCAGAQVA